MQGGRAARRACGLGRGRSIMGAVANREAWTMQQAIAAEIAPVIAARRAADELAGLCGHYTPEAGVSEWPRIRSEGEATHGGEVQITCGHGYAPEVCGMGSADGEADLAEYNAPLLAPALAVASVRADIQAAQAEGHRN